MFWTIKNGPFQHKEKALADIFQKNSGRLQFFLINFHFSYLFQYFPIHSDIFPNYSQYFLK